MRSKRSNMGRGEWGSRREREPIATLHFRRHAWAARAADGIVVLVIHCAFFAAWPVRAQDSPRQLLDEIGIDQRLDAQVPLELTFRNEAGKEIALGDYFGDKPVILNLVYFKCPMLCNLTLDGMIRTLRTLQFDVGKEFTIVTVSFDSREGPGLASEKKESCLTRYGRPGAAAGWHFLTGDEATIRRLTQSVGFRYAWDEARGQYAHAAGLIILTPQGRVSRYLNGVEFAARDLRLGLVEASANRIGTATDQVLLYCYHYDPSRGKYSLAICNALRLGGVLTMLGLAGGIGMLVLRERRSRRNGHGPGTWGRNPEPENSNSPTR